MRCNKLYTKQHEVQVMGGIGRQHVTVLLRIFVLRLVLDCFNNENKLRDIVL